MFDFFKKNKEIINYIIFGILTTLVNIVTYILFTNILHIDYMISNVIAWIVSVIFAYITNKIYVFNSSNNSVQAILKEITSFFSFRIISGIIDMLLMYVTVGILHYSDSIMKIVVNVIIIIINYITSKLVTFKK